MVEVLPLQIKQLKATLFAFGCFIQIYKKNFSAFFLLPSLPSLFYPQLSPGIIISEDFSLFYFKMEEDS